MRSYSMSSFTLPAVIAAGLLLGACSGGPTNSDPHAPYPPRAIAPRSNAVDQPAALTLRWSGGDPDGDPVTFTLYLGTNIQMDLVDSNLTDSSYLVPYLNRDQSYYWQIVSTDTSGRSTTSARYKFSTWDNMVFPLLMGDTWLYSGRSFFYNFDPDSLLSRYQDHVQMSNRMWLGLPVTKISAPELDPGDVIFFGLYEHQVETTVASGWVDEFDKVTYVQNHEDGLYNYGEDGSFFTGTAPKPTVQQSYRVAGVQVCNGSELLHLLLSGTSSSGPAVSAADDYPYRTLAYPLRVGDEWVYRPWIGDGSIYKKVVDQEQVTVPLGEFDCFKVQWVYSDALGNPVNSEIEFYDFISDAGLVKRSINVRGITITTPDYPDGIGTTDWTFEFVLTGKLRSFTLPFEPGGIIIGE